MPTQPDRPARPAVDTPRHLLLVGALRRDRAARSADLALPEPLLPEISAHRRLRGPYTAAGTLLRALVPTALERRPELVAAHEVEILTVAPELRDTVPARLDTLTSLAVPQERTRFYSRWRTHRIANGLQEFITAHLAAEGVGGYEAAGRSGGGGRPRAAGRHSILVEDLDHADPTDLEFLAVLLRRTDPALLTVVVCGTAALLDPVPPDPDVEPGTPAGENVPEILRRYCSRVDAAPVTAPVRRAGAPAETDAAAAVPAAPADPAALAAAYVESDGTDDDPAVLAAYAALPEDVRRALHDRRAEALEAAGERSHALGAIPYHREQGTDPLGKGVTALAHAMDHSMLLGFYHATLDMCRRGRALLDPERHPEFWWFFTGKMPTSLSALGRVDEAEAICDEARSRLRDPAAHIQCAYATAMLYTRHRDPSRRDHERALGWINEAIAIASLLPDAQQRAFNTVFHNNGLALIEAHRGRPESALALVTEGMAQLDRDLGEGQHELHRSVLRHNRATVLAGLGRHAEAEAEFRAVIAHDPNYPEYHLDLGNLLRRMDRDEEALACYRTALRLGPPIPEIHYNCGDVRSAAGDVAGALEDFGYVLSLDPSFVNAYVNRAGLLLDLGELTAAEADIRAGLALDAANPLLLAALGRLYAERGADGEAREAYGRALAADPDLVAALCGRATAAYQDGDLAAALADMAHAVEAAPDDPAVRYNRAFLLQHTGAWDAALADLDTAAAQLPDDEEVAALRELCLSRLAAATAG